MSELINSLTKEQKLAILSSLEMISQGSETTDKRKTQEAMIQKTLSEFKLSSKEWSNYIQNLEPSKLQNELQSLDQMRSELYLAYIFELLCQNGAPTNREYSIAENTCTKIAGMSDKRFGEAMEKFGNMGNMFK